MKAIRILITFWVILMGTNYSNAQTIDVTLNESFTGLYTVPSTYPDLSYYHIEKINGGSFTLTVDDANSGSFSWEPPSGPTLITNIITASESGPFDVLFTKTTGGIILAYHLQLHYKIATHSGILDASVGTWTDIKELTLPAGVTSVDMNVIASVANNFDTFVWNIEEDDLSLTPLNMALPGNTNDVISINMNGKSQIKIIIKAYDSDGSNYWSEDYFYIKSSGPTVYNLSGSGSYCEGSSGRTITLDNSDSGTSYQLKDGSNANVGIAKDGTGSALEWLNITAGSYTVVATNAGGTATMNGTVVITMDPKPGKATITGDPFVEKGSSAIYIGSATNSPTSWTWTMTPNDLATSTPSGQQTTLSFTTTGMFSLTAQATNTCGTGLVSDGFTVEIVDIGELEAEIIQLNADKLALQNQVDALVADTTSKGIASRSTIATLKTANTTLTGQLATAISERDQAIIDRDAALATNVTLTGQLATAISERDQAIIDRDAALATNVTLTGQLATVTQERDAALAANAPLIQQVTDLTAANILVNGLLDDSEATVAQLTADKLALQNALATAISERDQAIIDRDAALAANAPLLVQIEDLEDDIVTLEAQIVTLEAQITTLSQVYILSWEVTEVVTSVFETEIGNFSVSLYPNPSPGQVFIECTEEIKEVKIFSLQGTLIKQFTVNNTETSFVVARSEMPVGTYIVHIQTTKGTSTHKIIFQ